MEPRIQYATTADGVSIAFWTLGEGVPLVHTSLIFSHIQLEWQYPECRRWYERLAEKRMLVRYDGRGHGLSERDVASFSSATRGLECAIAMQRAFAAHNESAEEPIRVRIGLNAGEPIAEEEDLFGTVVIMAARVAAKAEGGEILTANVVRELAAGKGFLFADRGDVALRGFEDPVRLYQVRWQD